jgi:hypothetical protein
VYIDLVLTKKRLAKSPATTTIGLFECCCSARPRPALVTLLHVRADFSYFSWLLMVGLVRRKGSFLCLLALWRQRSDRSGGLRRPHNNGRATKASQSVVKEGHSLWRPQLEMCPEIHKTSSSQRFVYHFLFPLPACATFSPWPYLSHHSFRVYAPIDPPAEGSAILGRAAVAEAPITITTRQSDFSRQRGPA